MERILFLFYLFLIFLNICYHQNSYKNGDPTTLIIALLVLSYTERAAGSCSNLSGQRKREGEGRGVPFFLSFYLSFFFFKFFLFILGWWLIGLSVLSFQRQNVVRINHSLPHILYRNNRIECSQTNYKGLCAKLYLRFSFNFQSTSLHNWHQATDVLNMLRITASRIGGPLFVDFSLSLCGQLTSFSLSMYAPCLPMYAFECMFSCEV